MRVTIIKPQWENLMDLKFDWQRRLLCLKLSKIKHARTKGLLFDLMGKLRQACCSCYWWYVTLEPHLNTSKEAVRSDTVNRKSRLMTICLHGFWLCASCVYFKNRGKGGPVQSEGPWKCTQWWMQMHLWPLPETGQNTQVLKLRQRHSNTCVSGASGGQRL